MTIKSGCEIQRDISSIGYKDIVSIGDNDELLQHYTDGELVDEIINNRNRDIEKIINVLRESIE